LAQQLAITFAHPMRRLAHGVDRRVHFEGGLLVRGVGGLAREKRLENVEFGCFSLVDELVTQPSDDQFQKLNGPGPIEDLFRREVVRGLETELRFSGGEIERKERSASPALLRRTMVPIVGQIIPQ